MKEIRYIKRKELDVSKYDACIEQAVNSRIYAYSWYLDSVSDNWAALIYGVYEAVMPLPWRTKYFIDYIYTPSWIQQLGVFSKSDINETLIQAFIEAIPNRFRKISLLLNEQNFLTHAEVTQRTNFLLSLDENYENLYQNYRKDRKYRLKEFEQEQIQIVLTESYKNAIDLHKKNIAERTHFRREDYEMLEKLFLRFEHKNIFYYSCVLRGELIGSAVFLYNNARYYYLISAVNEKGRKLQAMSFILNQFIKDHAGEKAVLDFEGSMIPGIASFFKSFGAKKTPYYFYQKPFSLF